MERSDSWQSLLHAGQVIPACPLALNEDGRWSEVHQRALVRYYAEAGAGGLAVGVHTTQFEIRQCGLFEPVLRTASEVLQQQQEQRGRRFVRVAGICGATKQAVGEARTAIELAYDAGLLSIAALKDETESSILEHCHSIASEIPVFGFYLQPAVGGRVLSLDYWRRFCEIDNVVAIKIAAFNRYQTLDVVRAVIESGRDDIALYTGNDDNIIVDLLTEFAFAGRRRRIVGGLLGQWAVWTRQAVRMLEQIKVDRQRESIATDWLTENARLTDANAAVFDAVNGFAGCIAGVNEVLRRQRLLPSRRCLDPNEDLSPGQSEELDRVCQIYSGDDDFIAGNLQRWLTAC